jgi:hypothetical protein
VDCLVETQQQIARFDLTAVTHPQLTDQPAGRMLHLLTLLSMTRRPEAITAPESWVVNANRPTPKTSREATSGFVLRAYGPTSPAGRAL